jgi:hypothetical protein
MYSPDILFAELRLSAEILHFNVLMSVFPLSHPPTLPYPQVEMPSTPSKQKTGIAAIQ